MRPSPVQRIAAESLLALSASGLLAVTAARGLHAEQPAGSIAPPAPTDAAADSPITVEVTRSARPGCGAALEALINETFRESAKIAGQPSAEFLRPSDPNSHVYTLFVRFNHASDYRRWLEPPERAAWLERSALMVEGKPQY